MEACTLPWQFCDASTPINIDYSGRSYGELAALFAALAPPPAPASPDLPAQKQTHPQQRQQHQGEQRPQHNPYFSHPGFLRRLPLQHQLGKTTPDALLLQKAQLNAQTGNASASSTTCSCPSRHWVAPRSPPCTRCVRLSLSRCRLTAFPSELISHLTNLQVLRLCDNSITELPESVAALTLLRVLNVAQNKLTCLPRSLGHLAYLEVLVVSDNLLQELPTSLSNCEKIVMINVSNNPLAFPPPHVWHRSPADWISDEDYAKRILSFLCLAAKCYKDIATPSTTTSFPLTSPNSANYASASASNSLQSISAPGTVSSQSYLSAPLLEQFAGENTVHSVEAPSAPDSEAADPVTRNDAVWELPTPLLTYTALPQEQITQATRSVRALLRAPAFCHSGVGGQNAQDVVAAVRASCAAMHMLLVQLRASDDDILVGIADHVTVPLGALAASVMRFQGSVAASQLHRVPQSYAFAMLARSWATFSSSARALFYTIPSHSTDQHLANALCASFEATVEALRSTALQFFALSLLSCDSESPAAAQD